jgi:hypothetical protein
VPLKTIHVKRPCEKCDQSFYIFEPGENGKGMKIREQDEVIEPPGGIRLSLDFEQANGKFTRQGLLWYAENCFFQGCAQTPSELDLTLNTYFNYASDILESSPLVEGLDVKTEEGIRELDNRLAANKYSSEWWAVRLMVEINCLLENPKIEKEEIQKALWEMNKLTNTHSMLILKETLEQTIWSGYMINNLKNILKIWDDNQENDDENFWQKVFWDNAIILSQVFSFPVIFIEEKVYVGGKNLSNTGGNLLDFLLKNNLTQNTALIEIKTPKTKIIGTKYRLSVYSIYADITGSIVQIANYKDSLTKNYHSLVANMEGEINAFNPQCMVIAGNAQAELTDQERIKSFELFRNGLKDVQLVTYDELFRKIEILIELIEGKK